MTKRRAEVRKKRRNPDGPKLESDRAVASSWRYRFGRVFQFVGLLILPFGIASELVGKVGLGQSLLVAAGGALLFYIGYVLQNAAGDGVHR